MDTINKTAKKVEDVSQKFNGTAFVYELSEPVEYTEDYDGPKLETRYIVVSHVGFEALAFPSDEEGNVLDWMEVGGDYNTPQDHDTVVQRMGYEVVESN